MTTSRLKYLRFWCDGGHWSWVSENCCRQAYWMGKGAKAVFAEWFFRVSWGICFFRSHTCCAEDSQSYSKVYNHQNIICSSFTSQSPMCAATFPAWGCGKEGSRLPWSFPGKTIYVTAFFRWNVGPKSFGGYNSSLQVVKNFGRALMLFKSEISGETPRGQRPVARRFWGPTARTWGWKR